ncbi:MAG: acetylglutamate kinase [Betaproteobacteria bacterium]|nr:acetylglutamate kinase [Betaproteobacteria bacterium]
MAEKSKARVLAEALPYIRRYHGKTMVVKLGGAVLDSSARLGQLAADLTLLNMIGVRLIVVHGGGPQIERHLRRLKMPAQIIDGLRVTDKATMEVVEMVLGGKINKGIVAAIAAAGGSAVGVSGKDGALLSARRRKVAGADYGLVGEVRKVNPSVLEALWSDFIPVIAPLALADNGETLNVNADEAAAAVASAVGAEVLLLLTSEPGIKNRRGRVLARIDAREAAAMIKDKSIAGGMIPKVRWALAAMKGGRLGSCRILDGRERHSLLVDLLTDRGSGTMIAGSGDSG